MKENSKIIPAYKKESPCSYTAGSYATIEMLLSRPECARMVFIHSDCTDPERLMQLCRDRSVPVEFGDAAFKRVSQKENTYVLGLFEKYPGELSHFAPHVVLVNPGDMGNLGTIVRTLAAFNITDLALITPAADIWHPKTIRASMGSIFAIRHELFSSFHEYRGRYGQHSLYPFMLDGQTKILRENCPKCDLYTLIFGNEASGLPDCFHRIGSSIMIPQSAKVDSLNLAVAVGIGVSLFAGANGQI